MQEDIRKIRLLLNLTQEELANKLGISKQYLSGVEKGTKKLQQDKITELQKLCEDISIDRKIKIDFVDDKSKIEKNGKFDVTDALLEVGGISRMLKNFTPEDDFFCYTVNSNTMEPTIPKGSSVLVKYTDKILSSDNNIYLMLFNDDIFVRRVIRNLNEILICADNSEYSHIKLNEKNQNIVKIVGVVVAVFLG